MTSSYLAGLFDGEGSISIIFQKPRKKPYKYSLKKPSRGRFQLCVHICNTYKPVILELVKFVKGKGYTDNKNSNKRKGKSFHKTCYAWQTSNRNAKEFLEKIYPFLFIKKEQAKIAIDFQKTMQKWRKEGSRSLSDEDLRFGWECKKRITELNGRAKNPRSIASLELAKQSLSY